MTGPGKWPAATGTVRLLQAVNSTSSRLSTQASCLATAANQSGTTGWQWSIQARAADDSSGESSSDGKSEHPTRRSLKLARLEAVLLVTDGSLSFRKLAQFATLADAKEARELVQELNEKLDRSGAAFRIEKVATGVRMMTRPQFAMWLDRLHDRQARARLSPPMLETLSIVAYRQPVTRADVEKIRGVQASEMLRQLMERGLLRITGEDDSLGRPFLYGTTRLFLEEYGFGSLEDLPMADTLRRRDEPEETDEADAGAEEEVPQLFVEEEVDEESDEESAEDEKELTDDLDDDDSDLDEDDGEYEDEEWDEDDEAA